LSISDPSFGEFWKTSSSNASPLLRPAESKETVLLKPPYWPTSGALAVTVSVNNIFPVDGLFRRIWNVFSKTRASPVTTKDC
jgi:hypothetical protein